MELANAFKTLVTTYKMKWCHNTEEHKSHFYHHDNLKSQTQYKNPSNKVEEQ
jgi:hypothetical protein